MRKAILPSDSPYAQLTRRLVHLSGTQAECFQAAHTYLEDVSPESTLWITESKLANAIPASKAHTILGQELAAIVFDAFSGFAPNAFAAIGGTVRGGGLLILLTPPLSDWPYYPDPDYKRFLPYPFRAEQVHSRFIKRLVTFLEGSLHAVNSAFHPTRVTQVQVLKQMVQALARAQCVIVLTADRGRGKSASLGLLADQLKQAGNSVVLTAPARATVSSVFKHSQLSPVFIAPDELLECLPQADVLLVDEAAAIPLPLLLKMAAHYPRCVFSTTTQGYEGSGRGFVLRFQKQLAELAPFILPLQLVKPMRWAENDPLEAWLNEVLLLTVNLSEVAQVFAKPSYLCVNRDELVEQEVLLRQIFALLINAHYQTRPSDLRQLLDAPNVSIHALMQNHAVVAVALLSREGSLETDLTEQIYLGKRRPHGHLIPQTLTFHAGIAGAACLSCERVMRIAVHPNLQGCGLGSQLLTALEAYALEQETDYLGVSYALTPQIQAFWQHAGFITARQGYRRDTASGAVSLVQIKALSPAGRALQAQLARISPVH